MPVLKSSNLEVKQFMLPSTASLPEDQQAWVKAEVGPLTTGDIVNSGAVSADASPTQQTVSLLIARIKEWNFTDESGKAVEINYDNVCKLDINDFGYIAGSIITDSSASQLSTDEKKV